MRTKPNLTSCRWLVVAQQQPVLMEPAIENGPEKAGGCQRLIEKHASNVKHFAKFCVVGLSGTVVDMGLLFALADPRMLGWSISGSKLVAAEVALLNNFLWNEIWTFRWAARRAKAPEVGRRLMVFNLVCGLGILLSVALLHFFHELLGCNLYLSNAFAVGLVTLWNFTLNAKYNWGSNRKIAPEPGRAGLC